MYCVTHKKFESETIQNRVTKKLTENVILKSASKRKKKLLQKTGLKKSTKHGSLRKKWSQQSKIPQKRLCTKRQNHPGGGMTSACVSKF